MANISIRNLDDSVKEALRLKAAAEHCSMEEFLRRCLTDAVVEKAMIGQGQSEVSYGKSFSQPSRLQNVKTNKTQEHVLHEQQLSGTPPQAGLQNISTPAGLPKVLDESSQSISPVAMKKLTALHNKTIVLIIGGSIAAYKALEFIRLARRAGATIRVIMTKAATKFITPLVVGALAGGHVYTELFSREDEQDVGHIRLARQADIILVLAATASRLAKMATGQGDDLAGAVLLAAKAPVMLAPAMNPAMWAHPATKRNIQCLQNDGCLIIGPKQGEMAETGEAGLGRMSEPIEILTAVAEQAAANNSTPQGQLVGAKLQLPLLGQKIVITAGPTHEPFDPVRYIANHSSGKQGYAIAAALAQLGAEVCLVSGPVDLMPPAGVSLVSVQTAREMEAAVLAQLPADAAIFVAAVADWRPENVATDKMKKPKIRIASDGPEQELASASGMHSGRVNVSLVENPDILAHIGHLKQRPRLVVGFAAETTDLLKHATTKLEKKGADWIVANNVASLKGAESVMGGDNNQVHILRHSGIEEWPYMSKAAVAERLAQKIASALLRNKA